MIVDELWTQEEASAALKVSARYLRDSSCPKVLLPGQGPKGQRLVRYAPAAVRAWWEGFTTQRRF
jgi:hypothetical protein